MKVKLLTATLALSTLAYFYTGTSSSSVPNTVSLELPKSDPKSGYEVVYAVNVYNEKNGKYVNLNSDLGALAANIYFEAADQPIDGQIAVAWVTLNRIKYFNNSSIQGAVKNAKLDYLGQPIKDKCHFSWYCDGDMIKIIKADDISQTAFTNAINIANSVINKNIKDPTGGATHYCTLSVEKSTWWVPYMKKGTRKVIGDHVFYVHDQKKFNELWAKKLNKQTQA